MKKAHSRTSLSNIHSETQKLQRQNANVLRSRSMCCLLSHKIVEFPNSRHMYALRTYFFFKRALSCSRNIQAISSVFLIKLNSSSLLLKFLYVCLLCFFYHAVSVCCLLLPTYYLCRCLFVSSINVSFLCVWPVIDHEFHDNINVLLTEHEGRTGEYWPKVVAVQKRPRVNIASMNLSAF